MYFLGIETSCDETAAAVFTEVPTVLSSVVASQNELHARFGGVVPEVAARAHLRNLLPTIDQALRQADVRLEQIGAVAVHHTPGLVGALLVGVSCAKMLAVALDVPLLAVNHVKAHLYACRLAAGRDIFPCVGLVVSGGHTCLFHCRSALDFQLLGATIDDAAGEAFDKVASILELGFPGGPALERTAATGNPKAHKFPRSFINEQRLDFSFSGLKTAVLYAVKGKDLSIPHRQLMLQEKADAAASFQQAVVDVLVSKAAQALAQTGLRRLAVGGGVTANGALRRGLEAMAKARGAELFIPPPSLCTDNAAMAAMAVEHWRLGQFAPLDLDASPSFLSS
ncbi:MAG TPA: tRNA (adenosine(37)-N6)-threonylcarbamoyltransferase complex transferase subunit TsaD [Gemmataceae bacterium]|jgi:N6-L-threonylcarbamoyladenine synthase|nr:tRNA (adenosine(37)-N6)-threonylcarbamoyltransferase complex transferase subunit TsaD [Gemmataceae bacterium]